jgi:hypothetical protein
MKNLLKALLRKNYLTTDYSAQVVAKGNKGLADIVDELLKEGLEMNRETVIDIIMRFNRKSADMALSGYNVSTGLVNMRSFIKEPLDYGKWNSNINWVDVALSHGKDLYEAAANTTIQIQDDNDESIETFNLSDQTNQFTGKSLNNGCNTENIRSHHKMAVEPACGIAFRRWLCKA